MLEIYYADKDVSTVALAVGKRKWIGHRWTNHIICLVLASSDDCLEKTVLVSKMQTLPCSQTPIQLYLGEF